MKHPAKGILGKQVHVAVVGCGGNGSQMLTGLARLNAALLSLEHPGIHVTACDPDMVTHANVGRQLFSPSDVGQPKVNVLINRINLFFGLNWEARVKKFDGTSWHREYGIIIGCVDNIAARKDIARHHLPKDAYWLDLGNDATTGQAILGGHGLPTILQLHPQLARRKDEDTTPSCSLAEALERQDLYINQAVTTWGLHLLWTLFRKGGVDHHGYYINLTSGRVSPVPVPETNDTHRNDPVARRRKTKA